jgi:hypothetical protein
VIRIEPKQANFLELKAPKMECKVPPLNTYIELANMSYFKTSDTYRLIHYTIECYIVALGVMMYHNSIGGTETKAFHIIETSNGFYYLLGLAEQTKYITIVNNKLKSDD